MNGGTGSRIAAMAAHGVPALAGALLKVTEGPAWAAASPSAAMSTKALLEARVTRLETGTEPRHPPAGRHRALPSLAAALVLGPAFIWSAVIVVHYMPHCLPGPVVTATGMTCGHCEHAVSSEHGNLDGLRDVTAGPQSRRRVRRDRPRRRLALRRSSRGRAG
jgi:hypothetical protein